MNGRKVGFALCQVIGWVAMWAAHLSVGGFKGVVTTGDKLLFFFLIGLSCFFAFGSLLLLKRTDWSANSWVPVIGLVIMGASAAIISPVLASARAASTHTACLSNTKQILSAMLMYSGDWDDRLPSSSHWQDQIAKYIPRGADLYHCRLSDLPFSYGMNQAMSGISLSNVKDLDRSIVIFEAWSKEKNFSGGSSNFVVPHNDRGTVGFASGQAALIRKENREVIWKP